MVLYARFASYFNILHVIATVNVISEINDKKKRRILYYCIFMGLLVYYILLSGREFILESYIIDYLKTPVYID